MKELDYRNMREAEFINFLRNSNEKEIIIRTTKISGNWDDVKFQAYKAGRKVSKVYDENILRKNGWKGNFAEFYIFTK